MPRQKKFKPMAQEELENELYDRYGGMMSALDVARELGLRHHSAYNAWLADVPATIVNGLKRYRVAAVAEKIYKTTEVVNE